MLLSYGKKFTDQWASADAEKMETHWCMHLTGFTPREFKRGLGAMENLAWPPSLPEFKKLCRPPLDSTVAYYEAIAGIEARKIGEPGTWSHPAIFWAAMPLSFDLAHQTFSQVRVRWEAALKDQLEKGEWAEIPKPLLAVEYRKNNLSKKDASEFLESIGVDKMTQKKGSLDWAHRILNNQNSKVRTYPMISIQFAKEALTNSGRAVDEF
jgi:hypothetical protein